MDEQIQSKAEKRSRLDTIALVVSIIVFIPAVLIFATEALGLSEGNPVVGLFFIIILIATLPELLLHGVSQSLGFPVVLPAAVVAFVVIDLYKGSSKKKLSIIAVSLTALAILLYLMIRFVFDA